MATIRDAFVLVVATLRECTNSPNGLKESYIYIEYSNVLKESFLNVYIYIKIKCRIPGATDGTPSIYKLHEARDAFADYDP